MKGAEAIPVAMIEKGQERLGKQHLSIVQIAAAASGFQVPTEYQQLVVPTSARTKVGPGVLNKSTRA